MTISMSLFLNGSVVTESSKEQAYTDTLKTPAVGIALFLSCTNVSVLLSGVQMRFNKANSGSSKGGNLFIFIGQVCNNVTLDDSLVANEEADKAGGGYIIMERPANETTNTSRCLNQVYVTSTNFSDNKGYFRSGAVYILFEKPNTCKYCPLEVVQFVNSNFKNNVLYTSRTDSGVAVHIHTFLTTGVLATQLYNTRVTFIQCTFVSNRLITQTPNDLEQFSGAATLYIVRQRASTTICNSSFEDNTITAISAIKSTILFKGDVLIRNNSGTNGGGLILCETSYLLLSRNTTVTFEGNTASKSGGGIYAEEQCLQSRPLCFYQVYDDNSNNTSILDTIHVVMINNTANYTGSQIFGGSMDYCYTMFHENEQIVFDKIFNDSKWQKSESDLSYIASNPRYICFCNEHNANCSITSVRQRVYPGQWFSVALVAVGQFKNPVPATIIANVTRRKPYHRTIKGQCKNITFRVYSEQPTENDIVIVAVLSDTGFSIQNNLRRIKISYRHCPLGTEIVNNSCHYNSKKENDYYYDPGRQVIVKTGDNWIGYYNAANHSKSGFIQFRPCPQWYCVPITYIAVNETYFDQDSQCNNRKGTLCGACKEPLTLAIASSKCVMCGNQPASYIPLIVFSTVAIVFTVLLLLIGCNVTVTDGTLNGLLFYASIININRELFFPTPETFTLIASVFAWLNLDIGVSACFYNGFDGFAQVLTNFFWPVFIWIILGILIYVSSKSRRIAKLVGKNIVKVLATLILIAYTKILQTEGAVFNCMTIHYPAWNSSIPRYHWLVDGNVSCWQGKHLILVVIGVMFGLATVCFTLTLLCIQPLQRYSHKRGLKWVAYLKPFIDAYTSPHIIKDRYRFWPGLLLLCRVFFSVLFFSLSRRHNNAYYMEAVAITSVSVLSLMNIFEGVYKYWWLKVLNSSFYINLTILSLLSFSIKMHKTKHSASRQQVYTEVSLYIAFCTMLLILLYHVIKRLKESGLLTYCFQKIQRTQCWQLIASPVDMRNRSRGIMYVRLPQDEDQDREMNEEFDGERVSDNELSQHDIALNVSVDTY